MVNLFDKEGSGNIDFEKFSKLWEYIIQWQGVFKSYAEENPTCLSLPELQRALKNSNLEIASEQSLKAMVSRFSKTCKVNFDDFIHICILIQQIYRQFRRFNPNHNDMITIHKFDFLELVFSLLVPNY